MKCADFIVERRMLVTILSEILGIPDILIFFMNLGNNDDKMWCLHCQYYVSPESGRTFRSRAEALRYLNSESSDLIEAVKTTSVVDSCLSLSFLDNLFITYFFI